MTETDRPQVVLVNRCLVHNEENELLLLRRVASDSMWSGKWEFPGGKLDSGQTLREALEREVSEETGLLIELTSELVYPVSYVIEGGKYHGLTYVALFWMASVAAGTPQGSDEHDSWAWATYEAASDYDLTDECGQALKALGELTLNLADQQ